MKQYFKLSESFVWLLMAFSIFFLAEGFYLDNEIYHTVFISLGLMLFFIIWLIIFIDMLNHPIYNKTFWLISIFILPYISVLIYLFLRNKLIMTGEKIQKKKQ